MRKRITDADRKIGARIKARRQLMKQSQKVVGKVVGVSFQQIGKIESGENRITASNLVKIARHLGVEIGYFYGEVDGIKDITPDDGMKFLASAPGAQIVRAMSKITDARLRRTIAELVVRLADAANLAAHPIIRVTDGVTEGLAFSDD